MPSKAQRIGVLLCPEPETNPSIQLLDTSAVDLFDCISPDFLRLCGTPDEIVTKGHKYEILYIAEGKAGDIVHFSGGLQCAITVSSYLLLNTTEF